jgi:hypothetical protein
MIQAEDNDSHVVPNLEKHAPASRRSVLRPFRTVSFPCDCKFQLTLRTAVLFPPPVEHLLRDSDLASQVGDWQTELGLLQHRDDLLNRKPLPLHAKLLGRFAA